MRFILGDVETTGVRPTDTVCEVAYREIDLDFNTIREGSSLINPGQPIPPGASAVNGITDSMVIGAPTLDEFMAAHGDPFNVPEAVFVAHNAAFDLRYLGPYLPADALSLCTLACARRLYPNADNHKQGTLAYMLELPIDRSTAHSAEGDLDVLTYLIKRMCQDADCDLPGLLEVQSRRLAITKMPFGKHKGDPLDSLRPNYVSWLLSLDNLDPDLRHALENL